MEILLYIIVIIMYNGLVKIVQNILNLAYSFFCCVISSITRRIYERARKKLILLIDDFKSVYFLIS